MHSLPALLNVRPDELLCVLLEDLIDLIQEIVDLGGRFGGCLLFLGLSLLFVFLGSGLASLASAFCHVAPHLIARCGRDAIPPLRRTSTAEGREQRRRSPKLAAEVADQRRGVGTGVQDLLHVGLGPARRLERRDLAQGLVARVFGGLNLRRHSPRKYARVSSGG